MNVAGNKCVGGLVGQLGLNSTYAYGKINYSYAVGKVTGATATGGLVGNVIDDTCTASNSYYDIGTTEQEESASGTGVTTENMKLPSTYSNWSTDIWNIVEGIYPTLK